MLIQWNEQSITWFEQASAYTSFHKNLAQMLLPYLNKADTLCDLGSGIGLIDFALSNHLKSITAVDINSYAINHLNQKTAEKEIHNLQGIVKDAKELIGKWDHVLAVFHGDMENDVEKYLALAKKQLIVITHGDPIKGKKEVKKCSSISKSAEILKRKQLPYILIQEQLEYGQPFTSFIEADNYVKAYKPFLKEGEREGYLNKKLIPSTKEGFKYYLPKRKTFGIFIIRSENDENL